MIKITEDKSYLSSLDLAAIDNGIAELGAHSLRIANYFTEEQKQENSKTYETLTKDQWSIRCEQSRRSAAGSVEKIIDLIGDNYMIYQYKNKDINYSNDNWDLFFWCNDGDMSYVTLNTNTKQSSEQQNKLINSVLDRIQKIEVEGIEITIQYTAIYNDKKVKEVVNEYCEKVKNTFIVYGDYVGKIVKTDNEFLFRKKGAKKYQYHINDKSILKNVFSQ